LKALTFSTEQKEQPKSDKLSKGAFKSNQVRVPTTGVRCQALRHVILGATVMGKNKEKDAPKKAKPCSIGIVVEKLKTKTSTVQGSHLNKHQVA